MPSPLINDPDNADASDAMAELKATAATLLLRSPRLSLSQILELLDIGDAEFRTMTRENSQIQTLLDQRRDGTLPFDAYTLYYVGQAANLPVDIRKFGIQRERFGNSQKIIEL